tara:strand:- start:186 stop:722 length:537 start_codon:yes stop_codon:yes gene_type:complete
MSDERKRLDELIKLLIQEQMDKALFLTEDEDEGTSGEQLSWLDGQGGQEADANVRAYLDDSEMHLPWDDQIKTIGHMLHVVALQVIDHYQDRPGFTKEAAKREILETIEVPLDIFYGKMPEFGEFYSLDALLDEEFEEMNENYSELGDPQPNTYDINIDGGSKADMGEISENTSDNRE